MTKVTGWDNGLSQDYDKGLGRWFANRLGARQQLRQDFEMTQVLIDRATLEQLVAALENHAGNYKLNKAESDVHRAAITAGLAALAKAERVEPEPKLWLWKNFVDGKQEYWVFDNLYPININDDDPQTLGDPCGYALFKPSRNGRKDTQ